MDILTENEMFGLIEKVKQLSKQGFYAKAVRTLNDFYQKKEKSNILYSIWDDLFCWDTAGICGETCGETGIGGCCCGILALVLVGWGCACLSPDCACCGECSSEFYQTCICDTGKEMCKICFC
ncbi:MAG: hypothetical protein ACI4VI_07165 [Acutalibacteraceae bacterium]